MTVANKRYKVVILEQRMHAIREAGFDVCLIGLGSSKTALKYTHHLNFSGSITVDSSLATYKAMGWDTSAGLHTARTSKEAGERLKACATCPDASMFLIGGGKRRFFFSLFFGLESLTADSGITSASQNGGFVAVNQAGTHIPYFFRQSEAGDIPDVDGLVVALQQSK